MGIKLLLAIIAFAVIMILTGCTTSKPVTTTADQVEIDFFKFQCAECEAVLPDHCHAGKFGMCNDFLKKHTLSSGLQ